MDWSTNRDFQARLQKPDIQGLSYKEAFDVLDSEEKTEVGSITLPDLINTLQEAGELQTLMGLAKAGADPAASVIQLLEVLRDYGGTDIVLSKGHQHRNLVASLVAAGQLNKSTGQLIVSKATKVSKKWAGLKPGHIQNARYHMTGQRQEN